jgi:hypothetical protein
MDEKEVSGKTGEICRISGIYYCVVFGHGEIRISEGDIFPGCMYNEGHDTVWWLRDVSKFLKQRGPKS